MKEQAHGIFQVTLDNHIIECVLKGSFNEVGCLAYTTRVKEEVTALNGQPFAMLIDDLDLEGGTPEAYEVLNQYNHWLSNHPLAAKALIINSIIQKEIMLQQAPSLKSQNIEFFTDKEDAKKWLNKQLLNYNNT
ncbi:hypothetical protein HII17_01560 [Thalassotalea sp. M1531]|uniref:STAS/SEC14 domain-containing protein n=1 Tax=Thalassotalea algicola TaxID=2716224 RepID=A0A7Y0L934_9GAMM|nr:hypothetical protein [Thalassotalea algicola]NMP30234.1 hypothetical protein [Thalassotalea algicola]